MKNQINSKYIHITQHIELSNTQSIRVGIVDSNTDNPNSKLVIGIQKFWRTSDQDDWVHGKGFYVNYDTAQLILEGLDKAIRTLESTPEHTLKGEQTN